MVPKTRSTLTAGQQSPQPSLPHIETVALSASVENLLALHRPLAGALEPQNPNQFEPLGLSPTSHFFTNYLDQVGAYATTPATTNGGGELIERQYQQMMDQNHFIQNNKSLFSLPSTIPALIPIVASSPQHLNSKAVQNRQAQKRYRLKKEQRLRDLEQDARLLETVRAAYNKEEKLLKRNKTTFRKLKKVHQRLREAEMQLKFVSEIESSGRTSFFK